MNSFFYDSFSIMAALCAVEVIVLFWLFIADKPLAYVGLYVIFTCFSMESATFVGSDMFYGFKNFRLAGLNLAVWMLLPAFCMALRRKRIAAKNFNLQAKSFINGLSFFIYIGLFMTAITYCLDDNGFASQNGSLGQLVGCVYSYVLPFAICLCFFVIVFAEEGSVKKLRPYLYSIIVGLAIVFLACLAFDNYGNRGGLQSLQVSDVYFLLTGSLILIVYGNMSKSARAILAISGAVILVLSLRYNASGKIVIVSVLIPFVIIFLSCKQQGANVKSLFVTVLAVFIIVFAVLFLLPKLAADSFLLSSKIEQAVGLFSFGDNWLESMPSSAQMRVTEFLNIGYELINKPWFLPFGKGFIGTVTDGLGYFKDLTVFAFSDWELVLGAYYTMHESLNCFFLVGGVFGLCFYFSVLVSFLKSIDKSPWLVFGMIWFLLFYSYHLSITVYGVLSLAVGLLEASENEFAGILLARTRDSKEISK
ncbi:hypothetical protein [Adlercreutzia sp. ZJ242]|uniref:hypothetical protein n=1 Tax=Adlercreutzia sp. ZJ242 TaxID=2709409 RepID=UPI001980CB6E|nr:hypothetical protein [Adlercreutzia sp. ZJ242]